MVFGPAAPMMCMATWHEKKEKIYSFDTFKLDFYNDELVEKNTFIRDGIVIIIENLNTKIFKNITKIAENNINTPMLILFIYGDGELTKFTEDYIEMDKSKTEAILHKINNYIVFKNNCKNVQISMCREYTNEKGINQLNFTNINASNGDDPIKLFAQKFKTLKI